jgi:hypothetical protein
VAAVTAVAGVVAKAKDTVADKLAMLKTEKTALKQHLRHFDINFQAANGREVSFAFVPAVTLVELEIFTCATRIHPTDLLFAAE